MLFAFGMKIFLHLKISKCLSNVFSRLLPPHNTHILCYGGRGGVQEEEQSSFVDLNTVYKISSRWFGCKLYKVE